MKKETAELYNRIVQRVHAPKGHNNDFGGYRYRKASDILNTVKPILAESGVSLEIYQSLDCAGNGVYVVTTCTLYFPEQDENIKSYGQAKEADSQKGMSAPQLTGSASTYSKKYALENLFLIDDSEGDPDSYRKGAEPEKTGINVTPEYVKGKAFISQATLERLKNAVRAGTLNRDSLLAKFKVDSVSRIPLSEETGLVSQLEQLGL